MEAIREITGPFLISILCSVCSEQQKAVSGNRGVFERTQSPVVSEACPQTVCLAVKFQPMKGNKKVFY